MTAPFVALAKAQTMRRDINALRKAIRNCDIVAADQALDKCERWFDLIRPNLETE